MALQQFKILCTTLLQLFLFIFYYNHFNKRLVLISNSNCLAALCCNRKLSYLSGDTHMTSTLREAGRLRQKWDVIWQRRGFWTSNFCFFIKENWIWAMTRHHANNILLTRNLPFDSDVRQWSHPLMIPLHCLWAKSNNRTRGQFEYDVTLFWVFLFDFVHSRARCGCCSIVCLRFQDVQIKQVDCKMNTENVNNYN